MNLSARLSMIAFWLSATVAYTFAIVPRPPFHISDSDKVEHMTAFFVLAFLSRFAYPRRSPVMLALMLAFFGAMIEVSQLIPELHRDASVYDWLADVSAILVGLLIAGPLAAWRRARTAS